jgi:hypothetical protein
MCAGLPVFIWFAALGVIADIPELLSGEWRTFKSIVKSSSRATTALAKYCGSKFSIVLNQALLCGRTPSGNPERTHLTAGSI